jgi:hypothetical protein
MPIQEANQPRRLYRTVCRSNWMKFLQAEGNPGVVEPQGLSAQPRLREQCPTDHPIGKGQRYKRACLGRDGIVLANTALSF